MRVIVHIAMTVLSCDFQFHSRLSSYMSRVDKWICLINRLAGLRPPRRSPIATVTAVSRRLGAASYVCSEMLFLG